MNDDFDIEVHVTRVTKTDCYGHTTDHCDPSGCNGAEQYWPQLDASAELGLVKKGDLARITLPTVGGVEIVRWGEVQSCSSTSQTNIVRDLKETDTIIG